MSTKVGGFGSILIPLLTLCFGVDSGDIPQRGQTLSLQVLEALCGQASGPTVSPELTCSQSVWWHGCHGGVCAWVLQAIEAPCARLGG